MRHVDSLRMARASAKDDELLQIIRRNPGKSTEEYAEMQGLSWRSVRSRILRLNEAGLIARLGGKGPTRYHAVDNESLLLEALGRIEEMQPLALEYIRENGFVFEVCQKESQSEVGRWQMLAFSLYSDLCEANSIARQVREDCGEAQP